MLLSSVAFVSCEKEGTTDDENVQEEVNEQQFKANVIVSDDLIKACESIKFEYKDATGKLVTEDIDFSTISAGKYEIKDKEYSVRIWKKEFKYTKNPAEAYFKPIFTKDPDYAPTVAQNWIYNQSVSGAGKSSTKSKSSLGVELDDILGSLDSYLNIISKFVLE